MSFPSQDRFWVAAANFVEAEAHDDEDILAPDPFWHRFRRIYRYRNTVLEPATDYDWAILHKGELDRLPRPVLNRIARGRAVFANEVFVVLHRSDRLAAIEAHSPHLRAFVERLAKINSLG